MDQATQTTAMYGYVPYPAIGYKMGNRDFALTAMSPVEYVGAVGARETWDPLSGTGTNRKEDKAHRKGIAEYVENTEDYVLNAVVVYANPNDVKFVPAPGAEDAPIKPGTLFKKPSAKLTVGDGGHRTDAYGDVVEAHEPLQDEVFERLLRSGQPVIVVMDEDKIRRAQDFTDLQRNSKPLNASIGQSMDRRQALNRVLIEDVLRRDDIPLLAKGKRVEFLSDTPGKLSAKVAGYKTIRYASGTLLIGTSVRDVRGWDSAVALSLAEDERIAVERIVDFWRALGDLSVVAKSLGREKGVALLRNNSWLLGANVIYAVAAATYDLTVGSAVGVREAVLALDTFDFSRRADNFVGTLVDRDTGKAVTGRAAWQGAADLLRKYIRKELKLAVA
jgi:hypothetical protein